MKKMLSKPGLYGRMQRFADLTIATVREGRIDRAARCLAVADQLLMQGNSITRNAVANVYVHTLGLLLDKRDKQCSLLMRILPASIKAVYEVQVNSATA